MAGYQDIPADVRAKARELADKCGDGAEDFKMLLLSIGIHAAKTTFNFMVDNNETLSAARKEAIRAEIETFSGLTELGCVEIGFTNIATGAPDKMYISLQTVAANHDMSAEFAKVQPLIHPGRWPQVMHMVSVVFNTGRSVFQQLAKNHEDLVIELCGLPTVTQYTIGTENSTLLINPAWPQRIGVNITMTLT